MNHKLKFLKRNIFLYCALLIFVSSHMVSAQDTWPKEIPYLAGGIITIYEPQPEKLSADNLEARAAVSIRKKSSDEPIFGAMWIQAQLSADSRGNTYTVQEVVVKQSKFAEDEGIGSADFKKSVENGFPALRVQFSKNNLLASIKQEQGEENLKNDPPLIIYRDKPTTLIILDGEPLEEKDEDLQMTRVVNTPYLIVKNPDDKKYYLYGGSFWYSSSRVKEGWINVKNLPSRIRSLDAKMKQEEQKASTENDQVSKFTTPTSILVVTEPAELIQTEGKPTYQAVPNSTLLYVNNSLDEIFKDIDSQKNYILLAGRWFRSSSVNGPWEYVSQNELPPAFADIPAGSEKDGVLASVAGTDEAYDAVMEAQIPQTAKVDRNTAQVEVNYDGDPQFVPIENTNLAVAENSNITVMRAANNRFYALENGIWFVGNSAFGPWQVANERPADVDRIPPSNSAYNARYVQIYESTPQYVYVGYTQGYMGNYIYGPTVVYGTGWRYRPWRGRYYRPRPATWGFGMHYNPWTGWSMSFGLGFNVGWYHYERSRPYYGGGWFGPPAYRPPYRPWGWNGGYYGNRPGSGRPNYANRPRPAVIINRPSNGDGRPNAHYGNNSNLYRGRKYVVATRDNIYVPNRRPASRPSTGNNDRPGVSRPGNDQNGRPGTSRPSTGSGEYTRPGTSRPGISRPEISSPGNTRPGTARPGTARPGTDNGQNTRPQTSDDQNTRPGITPPDPAVRPSIPSNQNNRLDVTRPATGNNQNSRPVTRPEQYQRPVSAPSQQRPVNRPATNPGQNTRPAVRPSNPARTTTQPAQQPARKPTERSNSRGREQ
ncbi:hypothetical protein [Dyadobacter psychrotolerans]|uniref:Carbohydrate-binding family V/XII n=1 Tax=Dyadobacter psychrotolerans TaxID=2541721 RepID=A0A4R5DM48_9BACT|nr:hypothetical protein [Dyadobacter psychrotolerans]TDE15346.1 hypothetical protein E0F88_12585 [Dyadobacter psychrotolerans]